MGTRDVLESARSHGHQQARDIRGAEHHRNLLQRSIHVKASTSIPSDLIQNVPKELELNVRRRGPFRGQVWISANLQER